MNIEKLKQKYPNIRFYKLRTMPSQNMFEIEKIEDFFELVKIVGYTETQVDENSASFIALKLLTDTYLEAKNPEYTQLLHYNPFCEYVREHKTEILNKILEGKSYVVTILYGIDINVMFHEPSDPAQPENEFDLGLAEIDKLYKDYSTELSKAEEKRNKEINTCILNYKEQYLQTKTKVEKEEIIRKVQLELKMKFKIDGRNDYRASKIAIQALYEE